MIRLPILTIVMSIDKNEPKPYILLETHLTFDGPRTRVVDGRWTSAEEAQRRKIKLLGV